jgi:putative ABC transport system permease protein
VTGGLPRWSVALLRLLSPPGEVDAVLGDLAEAERHRRRQRGGTARLATAIDTLDMAAALVRARGIRARHRGSILVHDYKLGLRMLAKYPGLTVAGGLALALAIGIGAAWFDITRQMWRPDIPLPEGDRIVEIEMRDPRKNGDEHRIMHDFVAWRREARAVTDVGAYRTVQRNLVLGEARLEPVTAAEITAGALALARVPPLLGRPLLEADERPGAPPVVVLGYTVWQRQFGGRTGIVGQPIQIGRDTVTVVGVMPEGFAFPVNHRLWTPLTVSPAGYQPLTGPPIRVVARLAPGYTQAQAYAEVLTLTERVRSISPTTHGHLRPRVLAYGGQSPGDAGPVEFATTHLPILLVLLVACVNVGTLVYARTATRDAEIAMRFALGASRGRIVSQLFVEALVLSAVAAAVGLTVAHVTVKWATQAFNSGDTGGLPFWVDPGLKPTTVLFAAALTMTAAAILGVLPALKATRAQIHTRLRNLGAGATLQFGKVWTAAMIAQVAFAVICLTPARGISEEALRDRQIRGRFPAEEYVTVRLDLDRQRLGSTGEETADAYATRYALTYAELERRLREEPGVRAVTFGDRLPGMDVDVRTAQLEVTPAAAPRLIPSLWTAAIGPRYFDAFGVRVVAGRDFHDGDRTTDAPAVIVNEAFVRRFLTGRDPVGTRVRFAVAEAEDAVDPSSLPPPQPWLEIVGVVADIGMTPTDHGEAPYLFRPTTPAATPTFVLGVRTAGDAKALAPRVRAIAAALDPGLRLSDLHSLDDVVWQEDVGMVVGAVAIVAVVSLGLFLSAAGIYALMSVSVARRTREIGLRSALGASRTTLVRGVIYRAAALVGSGIVAGNGLLLLLAWLSAEMSVANMVPPLLGTSAIMLAVGLVACIEPARRALRIQPIEALKES